MRYPIILILIFFSAFEIAYSQKNKSKFIFELSKVNYEIIGSGKPVLMLHGMGVDSHVMKNSFEPVFMDLPNKWKRIYLDLPGMGKTMAFEWIKNSDDILTFLTMFINEVIPNEEFMVVGYSYGGYLARGLISKMEEKVAGGIFVCPLIIPDDKKRNIPKEIVYNRDTVTYNNLNSETKTLLNFFIINQDSTTIKKFNDDILIGHKIANRSFVDKIRNNPKNYAFSNNVTDNFIIFNKSTLFITAKQDVLVGFSDAQGILNSFPNNTFVVIDSAGHAVQIDAPRKFEIEIKKFLNGF